MAPAGVHGLQASDVLGKGGADAVLVRQRLVDDLGDVHGGTGVRSMHCSGVVRGFRHTTCSRRSGLRSPLGLPADACAQILKDQGIRGPSPL